MRARLAAVLAVVGLWNAVPATAETLRVGGGTFSDVVARTKGFYARNGLQVETTTMPSGPAREGLVRGTLDIADHGADNMVALSEDTNADLVIVMGTNSIPVVLVAQPGTKSIASLKGKTILVDDLHTQNAIVLRKMFRDAGLKDSDFVFQEEGGALKRVALMRENKSYAATMASMSTWLAIKHEGFVNLGSSETSVGPLLFYCVFVERSWAKAHEDVLVRYLASHIAAQRWMMDEKNTSAVTMLLAQAMKVTPQIAATIYEDHMRQGWPKDGAFDQAGFANVLKLRAEIEGNWKGVVPPTSRYVDLSYYEKALALSAR
jgi:ABC-type nitrate/sulfonate/bicarbonate transport system substrate-binding protein